MIDELKNSEIVVIGLPLYNFGPPAALKAWADLVARAGTTFGYTASGPEGLLADRPIYIVAASGGTPIDSDADHATPWLRQFLNFLGVSDVSVIAAEGLAANPEKAMAAAFDRIVEVTNASAVPG